MMSLWDALRMNMMISYQELVRTFPNFLAHFQYQKGNIALFANPHESPYGQKGKLLL